MSSTTLIRSIKKWWWAVIALTLAGGLAGAASTLLMTPEYSSSSQIFVAFDAPTGAGSAELVQANNFAIQKVYSYQEVVDSPRVLADVIDTLGLDTTTDELARDVSVSVPANSAVMQISATAANPQDAATLTTAVVESFSDTVRELETPSGGGVPPVRIESLQDPIPAEDPSSPNVLLNIALGLFVGLAAGVIWIAVAAVSDRRVYSSASLAGRHESIRSLGTVPAPSGASSVTEVYDQPLSRVAEAYRTVAATLGHTPGARLGIVAVASATPRDSTSALTGNLALAMQEFGVRTVLVDANLRSGTISSSLGLTGPGLAECLTGTSTVANALQTVNGLTVLPSGAPTESPAELFSGRRFEEILKTLRSQFDMVLVDAAPALPLSDTLFAATAADSTVLAVSAGRVTSSEVTAAVDALAAVNADVIGVVVLDAAVSGVDADPAASMYRDLRPAGV
ncbi:MAG TPA: Wzz/FepE/Etk N-terminal domain-containing protein [Microbacterium sp.]|uniref:Wzz/FepE/Etk N-terminal domain-containing protein n=1 Tax=Microbacterium sp. TaxID=51671 RepID=UPI002C3C68C5|nr:Wzz/FepE/Etk N-terminal domain-containing protein [Microbacterium sp.]HWI31655.1 Wzz/FepE/Etk N-terminal domain-containing protein [Microbacterium sp.]